MNETLPAVGKVPEMGVAVTGLADIGDALGVPDEGDEVNTGVAVVGIAEEGREVEGTVVDGLIDGLVEDGAVVDGLFDGFVVGLDDVMTGANDGLFVTVKVGVAVMVMVVDLVIGLMVGIEDVEGVLVGRVVVVIDDLEVGGLLGTEEEEGGKVKVVDGEELEVVADPATPETWNVPAQELVP